MVARGDRLKVSFTEDELDIVRKRAEQAGFKRGGKGNVAAYLRALALSDGDGAEKTSVPQRIVARKVPYKRALSGRRKETDAGQGDLRHLREKTGATEIKDSAEEVIGKPEAPVRIETGNVAMEHWFAGIEDAISLLSESQRGEKLDFDKVMAVGAEMAFKGSDHTAGFLAALAYWAGDYRPEDARWPMVQTIK